MAGLSLLLLVGVGLLTWSLVGPEPYVATPPGETPGETVRPAEAAQALGALEQAVEAGDAAAARAIAPADDPAAGDHLAAVVGNAAALRVDDLTLRYVDVTGAAAEGRWTAAVDVTWRFDGYDESAARAEVAITFVADGTRVAIAGVGGGDRVAPLWMAGPVTVRRTADVLVLVSGDGGAARGVAKRYLDLGLAALPVVRRVLPRWEGGLVLEVPSTQAELDKTLGADPGEYSGVAAVTAAPDRSNAPGAPVHVFLNPAELERLRSLGAQVVVSHEATHVATEATSSQSVPQWLLEGFADYVALRDVGLPETRAAAQIIKQVRDDGPPRALPGAVEFDASTGHAGAAYEAAWQACLVLAERGGERSLVRLYDELDSGVPLARALKDSFGWTEAELLRAWRTRLSDLAA
ncbi:MAG: hypothetical protein Q8O61_02750 [Nocardioides sp.]|nr:hypothetical protein [Nocardioides sp.]